jgi:transcriptional regulator
VGALVGIEIRINRLDGKFKLSQNKSAGDQARIAEGLRIGA